MTFSSLDTASYESLAKSVRTLQSFTPMPEPQLTCDVEVRAKVADQVNLL